LYEQADRDGNHTLSLTEITDFQKEVCSRFAYRENTSALPPNRFLSSGGGDCEDWALLTCGLLRYWGYECSLAVFSSRDPEEPGAHALAFLYSHSPPASGEYYFLDEETVLRLSHYSKNPATSGYYLPIDYTHVGSLSSAVAPHWVLSSLYCPEEVYGDPL
jgi:transglutaminase-like putative cysteine protease